MTAKTLSVVVLNYNEAAYIGNSLQTICEQSFRPTEVLVVDNCSTDNSPAIVKELSIKYPFIRFIQNDVNRGFTYSVNRGAKLATSDYLYIASANDLIYPGFFEKSMMALAQYPQAGLSCTDFNIITVANENTTRSTWIPTGGYYTPAQLAELARINQTTFSSGPNSIIRADLLPDQMYIPEIYCFGDWFLSKLIAYRYGCCYIPEPLAAVRWINNSLTDNMLKDKPYFQQLCTKVIELYASPAYEDIAPLIIRSRSICNIMLPMRTPRTVFNAIYSMSDRNKYANALFLHLTAEYFYAPFEPIFRKLQALWQSIYDLCKTGFYFLKNLGDRAYAKTFHEYNKAKSMVRKQLGL